MILSPALVGIQDLCLNVTKEVLYERRVPVEVTRLIMQVTLPLIIAIGLTGLVGVSAFGRRRQKVRLKVKRRP